MVIPAFRNGREVDFKGVLVYQFSETVFHFAKFVYELNISLRLSLTPGFSCVYFPGGKSIGFVTMLDTTFSFLC